jgi:hypothetical protein
MRRESGIVKHAISMQEAGDDEMTDDTDHVYTSRDHDIDSLLFASIDPNSASEWLYLASWWSA